MDKLKESKQIPYFKNLVGSISKGALCTNNVAWKSALYRAKWSECGSTHVIKYDPEFTEYWSIMQILFRSSAINVLRGPSHFGKIVDQIVEKGKFTPDEGLCNFTIPSCRILSKLDIGYDKEIPVVQSNTHWILLKLNVKKTLTNNSHLQWMASYSLRVPKENAMVMLICEV